MDLQERVTLLEDKVNVLQSLVMKNYTGIESYSAFFSANLEKLGFTAIVDLHKLMLEKGFKGSKKYLSKSMQACGYVYARRWIGGKQFRGFIVTVKQSTPNE